VTLKELLVIDEGGDCTGCPVCEPPKPRRSVSIPVRRGAAFSVRYTDARTNPTEEEVVIATTFSEA
jgi:hypothetical protein